MAWGGVSTPQTRTKPRTDGEPAAPPLERYFRVLETLSAFPEGLTLTELSKLLLLPKPTVSRLIASLRRSDLVALADGTRALVLGNRMRRMIHLAADDAWIESAVGSALKLLAAETGQTSYLARLEGSVIRSVLMESPDAPWRGFVLPGKIQQPSATASGKAIMAFQPAAVQAKALAELPQLTDRTLTTRAAIAREYARIREQGFATCLGEVDLALGAVAVPLHIAGIGVAYALGIVGPLGEVELLIQSGINARMAEIADSLAFAFTRTNRVPQ
jgi:DNA-binding IclR family transcriptional regulator